ncbi:MAG: hypothetical protein C4536_06725 [Actinobacteria bacterium]|jgi:hypothetical protein|nr:MAG: hypothetical protein C4536_06725 [Actinomycetota bacterium]
MDMTDTWFTEAERSEMATPVIGRIKQAMKQGKDQEAIALCDQLKNERVLLHDFFADTWAALLTWVCRNIGEEQVGDLHEYCMQQCLWRQYYDFLINVEQDKAVETALWANRAWVSHSCGGAGEHGGAFSVLEDDEKFTFIMDPCGSGGRILRKGRYESPYDFARISRPYPWTYGRENFPIYCVHCPFMFSILPVSQKGFIKFAIDSPIEPPEPCKWYFYKDRNDVPESYYAQIGATKRPVQEPWRPKRDRYFTPEELEEMAKPTYLIIRGSLEAGRRLKAKLTAFKMGGEFLYLHDLYVNLIVSGMDYIAREAGEESLGQTIDYIHGTCVQRQILGQLEGMDRREQLRFIIHYLFLADTCGGAGLPRGKFSVHEDENSVSIILDPCASGGRLLRHGSYTPMSAARRAQERAENLILKAGVKLPIPPSFFKFIAGPTFDVIGGKRKPTGIGVTRQVFPWSGKRTGLPYYCAFCTSLARHSGMDWLEVNPPSERRQPCVWSARK